MSRAWGCSHASSVRQPTKRAKVGRRLARSLGDASDVPAAAFGSSCHCNGFPGKREVHAAEELQHWRDSVRLRTDLSPRIRQRMASSGSGSNHSVGANHVDAKSLLRRADHGCSCGDVADGGTSDPFARQQLTSELSWQRTGMPHRPAIALYRRGDSAGLLAWHSEQDFLTELGRAYRHVPGR